ncbi:MAG TPA: hypothetical protein VGC88_01720 [Terriglobales bacterium]|jgi:hypothetical protein
MLRTLTILLIFCIGCATAQTKAPGRKVNGNVITSAHDPALQIALPESAQYVGADRWDLYGIADCELHAFVEADTRKNVRKLYWVQFEQYLPSRPDLHHTYDSPRHATIAGLDFYLDTWVRPNNAPIDAGSDREHIERLIRAKGLTMPTNMAYVRLVHLLDDQKRKELMIIYGEDLAPTGLSAADLDEHGKARDKWAAIEKDVIDRGERSIRLQPQP